MTTLPMTTAAHTPEPWTAELTDDPEDGSDAYAVDCPDHSIALMDAPGGLELNEANAKRIAAAVNACAGVPIEELEKLAAIKCDIPGVAGVAQMAMLNAVTGDEYDRLVAALRKLVAAVEGTTDMDEADGAEWLDAMHEVDTAMENARDLLDEATP